MTRLVVNVVLLLSVAVLLIAFIVGAARRRRREREQLAEDRRLLIAALAGSVKRVDRRDPQPITPTDAHMFSATDAQSEGEASGETIAELIELLEQRRRPRRGIVSGLLASPRGVWLAGTEAGHRAAGQLQRSRHDAVGGEAD